MAEQDEQVYICRCEEVTREEVEQTIRDGATTLAGVKKRTHAGMGLCQGRTCRKLIANMLARSQDPAKILPATFRPPVRTVRIDEIAQGDEE
ncbi:MAG: (2Fe-2S)-binding protein [Syntrophales bacterium]|jgi:bacterioferritin-associated ferredoxin|nr:(2Fe-2S)-binding protein [Syntrophales bacterium]